MSEPIRSALEHDEKLVLALGKISARWAMMEEVLCQILQQLLRHKACGRELYFCLGGFRQRIEMLKAAAATRIYDPELRDHTLMVFSKTYDHFKARNKIIHSPSHAIVETGDARLQSVPHGELDSTDILIWLGTGHPSTPTKINWGVFKNHLEKLDDLLRGLLWIMDQPVPRQRP